MSLGFGREIGTIHLTFHLSKVFNELINLNLNLRNDFDDFFFFLMSKWFH